ncbi:MAG: 3-phosphoshikimate 1-carboxyvinyltransferase [Bacteriovoracaceae bacterium]|nr:3-phosphoshikimate 1-carboxyvinyltransferase [Bacteriovoracaceae bacterium]
MNFTINPIKRLEGNVPLPGDKSLSHRALIFGALAQGGETKISNLLQGADVLSTKNCLASMGVQFEDKGNDLLVKGLGASNFKVPGGALNCGNSGTTIRLLMGPLSALSFSTTLIGDESLSKRPMSRVSDPLAQMGAQITLTDGNFAPINIKGAPLKGINYQLPKASAQVKTALLLAGLFADGATTLTGKIQSRDHTERLLPAFGVNVDTTDSHISIMGGQKLSSAGSIHIPGDISSASFWMAAACIHKGSWMEFDNISLNPTRVGFLKVLERMGAKVDYQIEVEKPEPIGSLRIEYAPLAGVTISKEEIPSLIDEIPILAVLATYAEGETKITGAKELRFKESDRIEAVASNLKSMGAKVETYEDGLCIKGPQALRGAKIETFHDHRIAMAFSIAALGAKGSTEIIDSQTVDISYPSFFETLKKYSIT